MFYRILYIILLAPLVVSWGVFAASESKDGPDGSSVRAAFDAGGPVAALPELVPGDPETGRFIQDTVAPKYKAYMETFEGLFSFPFLGVNAIAKAGAEQAADALRREGITERLNRNFSEAEDAFLRAAQLGNVASMCSLGDMYRCTDNATGAPDYLASYYWYVLGAQTEYLLSGAYPKSRIDKLNALKVLGENPAADPMARIASFYAEKWLEPLKMFPLDANTVENRSRFLVELHNKSYAAQIETIPVALRPIDACLIKGITPKRDNGEFKLGCLPYGYSIHGGSGQQVARLDLSLYPHTIFQDRAIIALTKICANPAVMDRIGNQYLKGMCGLTMELQERKEVGLNLLIKMDMLKNSPDHLRLWAYWLMAGVVNINEREEVVSPENALKEASRIIHILLARTHDDKTSSYAGLILVKLMEMTQNADEPEKKKREISTLLEDFRRRALKTEMANMCLGMLYTCWATELLFGRITYDSRLNPVGISDYEARMQAYVDLFARRFDADLIEARKSWKEGPFQESQDKQAIHAIMDYSVGRDKIPEDVILHMFRMKKRITPDISREKAIDSWYKQRAPANEEEQLRQAKQIAQGKRTENTDGEKIKPEDRGNTAHRMYRQLLSTVFNLNALAGIAELIEEDLVMEDDEGRSFRPDDKNRVLADIYRKIYNGACTSTLEGPLNARHIEYHKALAVEAFINGLEHGLFPEDLEGTAVTSENKSDIINKLIICRNCLLRESKYYGRIHEYAMCVYEGKIDTDEDGKHIPGCTRLAVAKKILEKITNLGIRNHMLGKLYEAEASAEYEALESLCKRGQELKFLKLRETAHKCLDMMMQAKEYFFEAMAEGFDDSRDLWIDMVKQIKTTRRFINGLHLDQRVETLPSPKDPVTGSAEVLPQASGASAVGGVESSDSDSDDETEDEKSAYSIMSPGGVSAGLDAAGVHDISAVGGPSHFSGTSLLGGHFSTSKAKKAPAAKPARHNLYEAAEKRAQLPKTFDRWEMSKQARKEFKNTPDVLQDKIFELIDAVRSDQPLGRMEFLHADLDGWTSRRITGGGRLVYKMKTFEGRKILYIKDCKGHYDD